MEHLANKRDFNLLKNKEICFSIITPVQKKLKLKCTIILLGKIKDSIKERYYKKRYKRM